MGILDKKRIVVTGVLTDASLAFAVARLAIDEGAEIVLTGAGRGLSLTKRTARRLPVVPDVFELDVTVPEQADALADELARRWGSVDGIVHAIGNAPEACLGGDILRADWPDVAFALQISTFSLKLLAGAFAPLLEKAPNGGSIVGLDFDARVAWPAYDWMGVAKAGLESLNRYLARDLGARQIRVNLIAAGPVRTLAAKSIPGFARFEEVWDDRAPLGWDVHDPEPVAKATVALLSDWFPKTTGEMIHVDGGFHATGA
ncbi:MAG TPA: enoyl-ACP reductase FabI [Acidimicrobiales bacterium]|nr:enoyl-ACP reductase FabI [Acidimicrobiales bacterium]